MENIEHLMMQQSLITPTQDRNKDVFEEIGEEAQEGDSTEEKKLRIA